MKLMNLLTRTNCNNFSLHVLNFKYIMLDFLKFRTFSQVIISRLLNNSDFEKLKNKGNHTVIYQHKKDKIKLECRKSKNMAENEFIFIDIQITPHYYFNRYKHNGNDFTPENCKKALTEIFFSILKIVSLEYRELQLINLEYGVNILPETDINNLIKGILFYKKTSFVTNNTIQTYKITEATSYKQIKAYGKGIQFANQPEYGINNNTFRFEVRSKQAKNIRKLGIYSLDDLFRDEVYQRLGESLLSEWGNILLVNLEPDIKGLKPAEVKYITEANKIEFWITKLQNPYRNCYAREVKKYYKKSQKKDNLHHKIRGLLIDKVYDLLGGANSTQKTLIDSKFFKN